MAGKKIPAGQLERQINALLLEYENRVEKNMFGIVQRVTKEGVKMVRKTSQEMFEKHKTAKPYWKGWTSFYETGKRSAQGTIYNKSKPGLPHLLEHGHANRGGGRTPGREHIQPVNDWILSFIEKNLEDLAR